MSPSKDLTQRSQSSSEVAENKAREARGVLAFRRLARMVIGMPTTKVTVTLDDEQIAAIRQLVAAGKLDRVSGFVKHAVAVSLADVAARVLCYLGGNWASKRAS